MDTPVQILLTLGMLLLVGLLTDLVGRRTKLPRVTLLLVFGILVGPSALNLLPDIGERWFVVVADMALVMVGFLLGEKLTVKALRGSGWQVFAISSGVVLATATLVVAGLGLLGVPLTVALLLGGIAPATAPAASVDVVHEARAEGPFSRTLLGIVAVDDAWGILVFSVMLSAAQFLQGQDGASSLLQGAWELGGAVLVGVALGIPMAYLTGRIQPGEPTLAEALGVVFLCGGLALWLDVSFLLAAMVLGAVVANLARHHARPFHAIEGIEWPFMILFFVLAGASLHLNSLPGIGLIGAAYICLRIAGRLLGAWVGGAIAGMKPSMRLWMGLALMPQAGVALGLALLAAQRFPQFSGTVLPVVVGSVVIFELIGPIFTRMALRRAGEVGAEEPSAGHAGG
jgi:Kef-type K+ transport system membrane component KefB